MQEYTLKTSDAFVVCPTHGDLFWHEGAGESTLTDANFLEPLRRDIGQPKNGDATICPLCESHIHFEVRPKVKVIR